MIPANRSLIAKSAQSQNMLEVNERQQHSVPAKFRRLWQCKSIDSSQRANELALASVKAGSTYSTLCCLRADNFSIDIREGGEYR